MYNRQTMKLRAYNELDDKSLVKKSGLFDKKWYEKNYPDFVLTHQSSLEHYIEKGWKERKNPGPLFSTGLYLEQNCDVKEAGICPLLHYLRSGKMEGRALPSPRVELAPYPIKGLKEPFFSIIVASYNYEDYIKETLDSLIKQTYRNFEVIVVDDGSKDGSVQVITDYAQQHPYIKLVTHEGGCNKGLPATVRLGISQSKGDYIAFCESDDRWTENHLAALVEVVYNYNNPAIISNAIELFGEVTQEKRDYMASISRMLPTNVNFHDVSTSISNPVPTFSAVCVKADILKSLNFDATIPAWLDWWMWRQVLVKYPLYFINEKITEWRIHKSFNADVNAFKYFEFAPEFIIENNKLIQSDFVQPKVSLKRLWDRWRGKIGLKSYSDDYLLIKKSGLFDEDAYREAYLLNDRSVDPIAHFLEKGWYMRYEPSVRFSIRNYLKEYPQIANKVNPLLHYLKKSN